MSWVLWLVLAWPVAALVSGLVLGPLLRRATGVPAQGTTPAPAGVRDVRFSANAVEAPLAG
jgi:hypothetical protein